jgi:protein TonB
MNPVSENRFLPSFLAIAASLVLVCGGLLLLTQTAPWTLREDAGGEALAPLAADNAFEAAAPREITFAPSASADGKATTEETDETDRGDTSQVADTEPAEPRQAAPEPVQPVVSEPSPAQAEDTVAASDVTEVDGTRTDVMDVAQVDETGAGAAEAITAESMIVSDAEPVPESTVEPRTAETAAIGTEAAEAPALTAAPPAATDQIGELLAESAPTAVATETALEHTYDVAEPAPEAVLAETVSEGRDGIADNAAAPMAAEPEGAGHPSASPEVTKAAPLPPPPPPASSTVTAAARIPLPPPPPPLPKRKPDIAAKAPVQTAGTTPQPEPPARPKAPKQAQAKPAATQQPAKQAQAASAVAEQATGQPSSGPGAWLPMALAPADKPIAKQPAARLSGAAYSSKVWAALARHKPRAGQNGSATVTFTIGAGGALNGVRIGKSSGNAKIDQLALATVRGAAPFPPPPSGPASFSIRIDFH